MDLTGRPMEGNFGLQPLEHSVLDVNLDSRLMKDELGSGPCTDRGCCSIRQNVSIRPVRAFGSDKFQ